MRSSSSGWIAALVLMLVLIAVGPGLTGCEGPDHTQTASFEAAEVHYRQGHYERALDGYQSFLKRYPDSPLAEVAELRIRTIKREVSSMLGRAELPRPIYRSGDPGPADSKGAAAGADAGPGSVERLGPEAGGEADE